MEYSKLKIKLLMVTFSFLLIQLMIIASANANSYYKASTYVEPTNIPANGVVNIHLTTQSWVNPDFSYAIVHQIKVYCPGGDEYMLGNAMEPINKNNAPPYGLNIKIEVGDDIVIPFGTGVGGPITIGGVDYYWWRIREAGYPVGPGNRVDLDPMPEPTGKSGTYEADVEGWNFYGVTDDEFRLRAFFDIPDRFYVPELALPISAVTALGFTLVFLKSRRRQLTK
ncbi:MAG: hypothetical protein QW222_03600 [Candidatus Bathyarchaeia archaeon]